VPTPPFTVGVPFGPFDTGDAVTAAEVLARVPGADVDRLVRLGSLIPPAGVAAVLVPVPVTAEEADLVAELQQRLADAEADRDLERDAAAAHLAQRDALAKRVEDLEGQVAALAAAQPQAPPAPTKAGKSKPAATEPVPPAAGS
jgi:hypothetical protein